MTQIFQDAIPIVRRFRKPSLFITVICNHKWPEIIIDLHPGKKPED